MDINSLRSLADHKFKHEIFRKNLRERIEAQLAVAHNGGLFKATPELISFLTCWDTEEEVYLEDTYKNPIKCDRSGLLTQLKEAYQYAMNSWHKDFEDSKKIRQPEDV